MTPHDMTDEQLRVRVAELLYLNGVQFPTGAYESDLNACHEMEKAMTPEQRRRYLQIIKPSGWEAIFATARQRCEAFVEVMEGR